MKKRFVSWILCCSLLLSSLLLIVVSALPETTYQAEVIHADQTTTQYETLTEALENVEDEETVKLLENISDVRATIHINKSITFDGNGMTISGSVSPLVIIDEGMIVTVNKLTVTQSGKIAIQVMEKGILTLTYCNITSEADTSAEGTIVVQFNANLILGDSTTVKGKNYTIRLNGALATLSVNSGATINSDSMAIFSSIGSTKTTVEEGATINAARYLWFSSKDKNQLTINGGTFTTTAAEGSAAPNAAAMIAATGTDQTVTINGGTFTNQKIKKLINGTPALALGGTITFNDEVIFSAPQTDDIAVASSYLRLRADGKADETNSGITFESRISKAWWNAALEFDATLTVEKTGTLIATAEAVEAAGAFTKEALKAKGQKHLEIENNGWYNADSDDDFHQFYGTIVNMKDATVSKKLVGITYVTVTIKGLGTVTIYGEPLESESARDLAAGHTARDDAQQTVLNFFRGIAESND